MQGKPHRQIGVVGYILLGLVFAAMTIFALGAIGNKIKTAFTNIPGAQYHSAAPN